MQKLAAVFSGAASWIRAHRWSVLGCVVVVLVLGAALQGGVALAGPGDPTPTSSATDTALEYVLSASTGGMLVNLLAWMLTGLSTIVGQLIITLIDAILVPILNYNGFATSQIVDLGWSLVRDTVNMFVVVILLVIAALTIVGSPKANWQQQIPRLFIFTVAVNFSRTICGILIDVSNVVMFQFVNAILAVGAGNFTQLLQIQAYGDYSSFTAVVIEPLNNFATAWLQLALMLAVLGVILVMTLVYLYRIVLLWLLIIMSPLAFFASGIKDIVGPAGSVYGDWMKKFTSALFMGPVLTFFLWLALAISSGSVNILTAENFPTGETTEGFGLMLKVLEMSNLTSLLLALVLLVVGMQMAGSFASNMGSVAGKLINGGMGQTIAKRALMLPARGFREVGRQTDRWGGRLMDNRYGTHKGSVMASLGSDVINAGERLRGSNVPFGSVMGRLVTGGGDKLVRQGEGMLHDAEHNAEADVKNWSDDRKASEQRVAWREMQNDQSPLRWSNNDKRTQITTDLATRRAAQKNFEDEIRDLRTRHLDDRADAAQREFDAGMGATIAHTQAHRAHNLKTDADKTAFEATRSRYVDLLENPADFINSSDFNAKLMRTSALSGTAGNRIQTALENKVLRYENGVGVTAWQEMVNGVYGRELQGAAIARGSRRVTNDNVNALPQVPMAGALGPAGAPFDVREITANITAGNLDVSTLTADQFSGANPNRDNLITAITQVGRQPADIADDAARDAYTARLTELADAGRLTIEQRARTDSYNLEHAATVHSTPGHTTAEQVFANPAAPGSYDVGRIANAVERDAMVLRHLSAALAPASPARDNVSTAVANSLSPQTIRDLARAFGTAVGADRAPIVAALQNAVTAMENHLARNPPRARDTRTHEVYDLLEAAGVRTGIPVAPRPPSTP